jgi:hypothetical protein
MIRSKMWSILKRLSVSATRRLNTVNALTLCAQMTRRLLISPALATSVVFSSFLFLGGGFEFYAENFTWNTLLGIPDAVQTPWKHEGPFNVFVNNYWGIPS